jgi:hypothetical protein
MWLAPSNSPTRGVHEHVPWAGASLVRWVRLETSMRTHAVISAVAAAAVIGGGVAFGGAQRRDPP